MRVSKWISKFSIHEHQGHMFKNASSHVFELFIVFQYDARCDSSIHEVRCGKLHFSLSAGIQTKIIST